MEDEDARLSAIIVELQHSDVVWTKYGSETIEQLAQKILSAIDRVTDA